MEFCYKNKLPPAHSWAWNLAKEWWESEGKYIEYQDLREEEED